MDEKIKNILSKISNQDKLKFGDRIERRISESRFLQNPENDYRNLREFLEDHIQISQKEIEYILKYTPTIYHPNAGISRRYEIELCKQILEYLQ